MSAATVYRALHAMNCRYRRPRHDWAHRQDAEAVASAIRVLAELGRASAGAGSWLPASTSKLILIERFWRYLKQKLACHRYGNEVAGLEITATRLLDQIEAHFHDTTPSSIVVRNKLCEAAWCFR